MAMENLLETIHSPADMKQLTRAQLKGLCQEIREELLKDVSQTGGHLASNLGVVELTVALHYVLQCPKDKIVWDVGHQAYVHKILTGRREQMKTLRQFKGMSGFPKRSESDYDAFGVGHSSTAVSAALGMAVARDLRHEDYHIAAVVGDGAMTGGMTFEGLTHAVHEKRKLLVILNDNAMSISPNEGALSSYLDRLRSNPNYHHTKDKVSEYLKQIPGIGSALECSVRSIKEMIRYLVLRGGTVFEELGWTYIGPVDGHDLNKLIKVLKNSIQLETPVLLHVVTKKGRGYRPAEENPDKFHGIGCFDIQTGQAAASSQKTYTNIFTEFILQQGKENPDVVAITAAMPGGTGLEPFAEQYPGRFFDVGICEQHAVTLAAGMACQGLHPVVCLYSTFLQRAFDQVIHDVALQNLPVVFAIDRAGLVGDDGATHQGVFDLSFLRDIPNIKIYCPTNGMELYEALEIAVHTPGPVVVRYPRGAAKKPYAFKAVDICEKDQSGRLDPGSFEKAQVVQTGQKLQKNQKNRTIVLIGTGRGYDLAEQAYSLLTEKNIQPVLLKFISVKPLDREALIQAAKNCSYFVSVEDSLLAGGFSSAVLECLNDAGLCVPMLRIGIPDEFVEQGKVEQLWDALQMTPEKIVEQIQRKWPDLRIMQLKSIHR